MPDRLVRIASYWYLPEAELARARLVTDGISAYLGNATFISWYWHYANAVGGVKVFVRSSDEDRALRVLSSADDSKRNGKPAWACPKCDQRVDGTWQTCWCCGTSVDGIEDPTFGQDQLTTRSLDWPDIAKLAPWVVIAMALYVVLTGISSLVVFAWSVVFVLAIALFRWLAGTAPNRSAPDDTDALCMKTEDTDERSKEPPDEPTWFGDEIARRAWHAAVFGLFGFPPLLFTLYSIWLLLKRIRAGTPTSPVGNRRLRAAWAVNFFVFLVFAWALIYWLVESYYDAL